ncbi:MAG TPA: TonB-dependent receptor [Bacteroidota bacterium]|nr:TonB-dependent receptor [Bacteroidota bacterium]
MKTLSAVLFLLVLFLTPLAAFAQCTLQGVVTDSTTHDVIIGVNVFLTGTAIGSATDIDGEYRITGIPQRAFRVKVSCIGYEPQTIDVDFTKNTSIQLNVLLKPAIIRGKEVVVTGQMSGQMAAINQQLTATTIENVVSEEKIQELPDANAAEAIGRLPGVSLLRSGGEASQVVLRGMSPKFSTVTVDGVRIASTDENDQGVDLSTIAQGSLAGIELSKALTADKDGDAIAGTVNLVTKKAPSERLLRLEPIGSYNALDKSTNQYNFSGRYGERFFDDRLGIQASGNLERLIRSNESTDYTYDLTGFKSGNDYEITQFEPIYTNEIRKRGGGSLLFDYDTPDSGSVRFNTVFDQTSRDYLTSYRTYVPNGGVAYDYRDRTTDISTFNTSLHGDNYLLGFEETWNAAFARSQSHDPYDFELNFTESSTPSSGMKDVPTNLLKGPVEDWVPYAFDNFNAAILNQANDYYQANADNEYTGSLDLKKEYSLADNLSGVFKFGGKYRQVSRTDQEEEFRANYYLYNYPTLQRLPDGSIGPKDPRVLNYKLVGGRVIFSNFLDPNPPSRSIYGKYSLYPLIDRDALELWRQLNINGVTDASGGEPEYYRDNQVDGNGYSITERVSAGYAMNTFNFGREVSLILGARIEADNNDYTSKFTPNPISGFPFPQGILHDTTANHSETIVLPNVQGIVRPLDFMNIRLAAYEAIARPDFNMRLAKYVAQSASGDVLTLGNPDLKNADAWNYELQTQFYGNDIGLFSVSAFYKVIKNMYHIVNGVPVQSQAAIDTLGLKWKDPWPVNTGYDLTAPYNSTHPTLVWGFEVEHQANFGFLPGYLKNIVLNYNFSIVRSQAYLWTSSIETTYVTIPFVGKIPNPVNVIVEKKEKLEDQPEFFGNASLGYDIDGFSFRISGFYQGSYNSSFSSDSRSDIVEDSFTKIDIALKQKITDHISVLLNLNNITNAQEGNSYVDRYHPEWDLPNTNNKYGFGADLGVRIDL